MSAGFVFDSSGGDAVGRPIRPNVGIRNGYRDKMQALVDDMYASIFWWIEAEYKRQQEKIIAYDAACHPLRKLLNRIPAFDESPAAAMRRVLRKRFRQWRKKFDENAETMARAFAQQSARSSTVSVGQSIGAITGMGIPNTMTRAMNNALQSIVFENVSLVSSIPVKDFADLEGMIMRSVRSGRDITKLRDDIEKKFKISRERAATIARDQTNKATESLSRVRMQENGITKSVWIHSKRVKTPRTTHEAMHGKEFELSVGMLDSAVGGYVQPGELINCACTKAPVVPGFARRKTRAVVPGTVEASNA